MKKLLLVAAAALITAGAFALTNGDFEAGTVGGAVPSWFAYSGTSSTQNGTRTGGSGTKVAQMINPDAGGSLYQTESAVVSGQTWQLTGWVKVDVAGTVAGNFGWFGTVSPYNPGPDNKTIPATVAGWTQYTATQLMNSAVNDGYRDAQVNVGAGGTYQFDDFAAQQVSNVNDWALY